jgi:hypothetical protein
MQKIETLDTLENLANRLEYLVSSHYSFLHEAKEGGVEPNASEIHGYMQLHNQVVTDLRTFRTELQPLLFPSNTKTS